MAAERDPAQGWSATQTCGEPPHLQLCLLGLRQPWAALHRLLGHAGLRGRWGQPLLGLQVRAQTQLLQTDLSWAQLVGTLAPRGALVGPVVVGEAIRSVKGHLMVCFEGLPRSEPWFPHL